MPKSKGYQYWPFSAATGGKGEDFRPPSAFVTVDAEEVRRTDADMESLTFLSPSVLLVPGASEKEIKGKKSGNGDAKGEGVAAGLEEAEKKKEEKKKKEKKRGAAGNGSEGRDDAEADGTTVEGRGEEEDDERGGGQAEDHRGKSGAASIKSFEMQADGRRRNRGRFGRIRGSFRRGHSRDRRIRGRRSRDSNERDHRDNRETESEDEDDETDIEDDETEVQTAVETVDDTVDQTVDDTVDQTVDETVDQTVDETVDETENSNGNDGNEDNGDDGNDRVFANSLVAYESFGDPHDVLAMVDCKKTVRGMAASMALVKVEASTVSRMDTHIRRNLFHRSQDPPIVPGCDMVGTIVDIASPDESSKFRDAYGVGVGDRVATIGLDLGGNARYVSVEASRLVRVPHDVDGTIVACLLRSYVTAYQALYRAGGRRVREEDRVLVVGGNGCVGQAAIQIAKAAGAAAVFATTGRTGGNMSMAECQRFLGAMGAVSVGREAWQWLPQVEGKMDVVIDCVCEDGYDSSMKALKPGGKLVCIDAISCLAPAIDPSLASPILPDLQPFLATYFGQTPSAKLHIFRATYTLGEKTEFYDLFGRFADEPGEYAGDLAQLFRMLRAGTIRPRVVKAVVLHDVANAHQEIEKGGMNGHIVCRPFADGEENLKGRNASSRLRPIRRWSIEKWKTVTKDKYGSDQGGKKQRLMIDSDESGKKRARTIRARDDPRGGGKEQSWGESDSEQEDESEVESKREDDDSKEKELSEQRRYQEQEPREQRELSDGQDSGHGGQPGIKPTRPDEAAVAVKGKRGKSSDRSSRVAVGRVRLSSENSSGETSSAQTPIKSNKTSEKTRAGGKHGAAGVVIPSTGPHTPPSKARAAVEVPGILRTSSPRRCGRAAGSPTRRPSSPVARTTSPSRSFSQSEPRGRQQHRVNSRASSPVRSRSRSRGQRTERPDSRSRSQRTEGNERPNSRSQSQKTEKANRTERSESRSKSQRAERSNSRSRGQRSERSERRGRSERPESRSRSKSQSRRSSERPECRTERSEGRTDRSSGRDPADGENNFARHASPYSSRGSARSSGSTKDRQDQCTTGGAATVAVVKSSSFSASSKSTKKAKESARQNKQDHDAQEELDGSNKRFGKKTASRQRRKINASE